MYTYTLFVIVCSVANNIHETQFPIIKSDINREAFEKHKVLYTTMTPGTNAFDAVNSYTWSLYHSTRIDHLRSLQHRIYDLIKKSADGTDIADDTYEQLLNRTTLDVANSLLTREFEEPSTGEVIAGRE